jgi:nicotinamidase-related amidase
MAEAHRTGRYESAAGTGATRLEGRAMADVLLVIDVQRALLEELPPARREELLATLVPLLERARAEGTPVVYVRHDGSPGELIPGTPEWEIGSEIAPRAGEPIVDKRFGDAFVETNLEDVLSGLEADHLIATGMQTDFCVNATIGGAVQRGYRVTLVADAHATCASGGKTEEQIREAMHEQTRARGAQVVPAAELSAV